MRKNITVQLYQKKNGVINKLRALINEKYSELFIAVILHGSIATNEIIPYSDFDGLLIVKDKFIDSEKIKRFRKESMKIIYQFDPLQHHKWFQINNKQLKNYPENYLPHVVLENAKTLYPLKTISIEIEIIKHPDFKKSLESMTTFLERKISQNWTPRNMYQLKSFLSEIMLLPTLYYSAKHGKGIFKKQSFELVKNEFEISEWSPIQIASEIREDWVYQLNYFQRLIMTREEKLFRKITEKLIAPKIPVRFSKKLNTAFFQNLRQLMNSMRQKVFLKEIL
ncbi:MAG: nucleotidyltransferase domain-containing protein [Bacteroidetes bacterium]|nr:nucleotidyltransferase domain-containing protein [Bacteroidota bacterium]